MAFYSSHRTNLHFLAAPMQLICCGFLAPPLHAGVLKKFYAVTVLVHFARKIYIYICSLHQFISTI